MTNKKTDWNTDVGCKKQPACFSDINEPKGLCHPTCEVECYSGCRGVCITCYDKFKELNPTAWDAYHAHCASINARQ